MGYSSKDGVLNYIANQEDHHKNTSFEEEFKQFLEIQGIKYDPKYLE